MEIMTCLAKGNEYRIEADAYRVNLEDNGEDTVVFDNLRLYENGAEGFGLGENFWGHHFDKEEAAASLIRAYINDNSSVRAIKVDKNLAKMMEKFFTFSGAHNSYQLDNGGMMINRPISKRYLDEKCILPLQLIDSEGNSYYSNGDAYACLLYTSPSPRD